MPVHGSEQAFFVWRISTDKVIQLVDIPEQNRVSLTVFANHLNFAMRTLITIRTSGYKEYRQVVMITH